MSAKEKKPRSEKKAKKSQPELFSIVPSDAEGLEFVVSEAIFGAAKAADEARKAAQVNGAQDAYTEAGPTVRTTLAITNVTEAPIAFKVKTTKPERYLVRPNQDVLAAGSDKRLVVYDERGALVAGR